MLQTTLNDVIPKFNYEQLKNDQVIQKFEKFVWDRVKKRNPEIDIKKCTVLYKERIKVEDLEDN